MPKVSAALVVYHVEAIIAKCIHNLKDVVDEFVIVHDGPCSDRTIEILDEFRRREGLDITVLIEPHIGSPEPHRPLSFARTKYEWVLPIDPDTYLPDDMKRDLPQLLGQSDYDELICRVTFFDGIKHTVSPTNTLKTFFRRSKMYHLGIPHFPISTRGRSQRLDYVILHEHRHPEKITVRSTIRKFRTKYIPWAKDNARYLLMPYEAVPKFQATRADWDTPKRRRDLQHPLAMAVIYFLFALFKNTFQRRYFRLGKNGFYTIVGSAAYSFATYYYVWKYKRSAG